MGCVCYTEIFRPTISLTPTALPLQRLDAHRLEPTRTARRRDGVTEKHSCESLLFHESFVDPTVSSHRLIRHGSRHAGSLLPEQLDHSSFW